MGNNLVSPCFPSATASATTKLIFWGGATRLLPSGQLAGELLYQFPNSLICHSNSFFIGHPVPALSIHDQLISGETYFILPSDHLPAAGDALTAASLALLSSTKGIKQSPFVNGKCPFEYVKGSDGKALIKVLPEFIERMISGGGGGGGEGVCEEICSTPELKKQYEQLVGSKNSRVWSPRLETITESSFKVRLSPGRILFGCDRNIR